MSHLQIMLRTHGELGYRQEQRFHLELGLLKMAHAQRLLPIEQLLSDVASSASHPAVGAAKLALAPLSSGIQSSLTRARRDEPPSARSNSVSPFAADSARKGNPKAESASSASVSATSANVVIMGSAAPAVEELSPAPDPQPVAREARPEARPEKRVEASAESLRDAVLNALGNQQMLVSLLQNAEWRLEANALIAKVAASSTMIEMSFPADARRIASAAASGLAGRPIKMLLEPDGAPQAIPAAPRSLANGSARSRAEQDPIVQRMQEKFGAEIRTVIDYREKG
jgi:DNA polymerase-3 subunit gamma/tau